MDWGWKIFKALDIKSLDYLERTIRRNIDVKGYSAEDS